jgi:outer membrane protein assembly factor BamD (BamD/ComL family)
MPKKKRKKKKKNQNAKKLTPRALASRAKSHLAAGRFRQAVTDYKTLMQQDRDV